MILKPVTFLCTKISAYCYTTNKGIQIHFKSGKTLYKQHLTKIFKKDFLTIILLHLSKI